ncbi:helix-turn-helix transcriptional regulator (plasmid) [Rhizobium grahamii]|uniref:Helix-turn-helix transcriptional regulator n=1 Tax=Rhizobium grahamii TaxID=1120045 RepID=A0A5Q0CEI7_9HYPH|nr:MULTISPECIES: AraC family transcriptional regulator [Rhizobium]QFY63752.1 helix-turn-helix transcriptional regulator [Rhizobium grahamii]QRM51486.1 helix-turn-helix transcriptional regulator [Rhizobium sp. BG6]
MSSLLKAHEFFGQMQAGNRSFRLLNSNIESDKALLKGSFSKTAIRSGLSVHYSDVTNLCDLHTETEAPAHLGIKLFFRGGVSASIGNQDIPMPRRHDRDRWTPSATLFHQKGPEVFRRRAAIGDRVRKLTIKIFPEWLESGDMFSDASANGIRRFTAQTLAARSWTPSAALLALAEQVIRPPAIESCLSRLYIESRVLGIIGEAFGMLSEHHQPSDGRGDLTVAERRRLILAEELIASTTDPLSLEEIAATAGVGVNTLQRLFHAAHDTTVFHYVRARRLEQARLALENEELSIAQAAYMAGYTSAANFSTAFKRRFGFTPKDARRPK